MSEPPEHDYRDYSDQRIKIACVRCGHNYVPWWNSNILGGEGTANPPCEPDKYRAMWSVTNGRGVIWREPITEEAPVAETD